MNNVQILFGAEGIKRVYEESLTESVLDIVCLANNYKDVLGDYFETKYAPRLYGKVATREILSDNEANRADAKTKDQAKNAVRFIKNGLASESDMLLTSDKAVLISYGKDAPMAVVITDRELVNSLRSQFEVLWQSIK